jgi:hypothetical protein
VKKVLFALLTFAIGATALPTGNTASAVATYLEAYAKRRNRWAGIATCASVSGKLHPYWELPRGYRCRWRVARLPHWQRIYRRHAVERSKRLFWPKRKSRTSAWRRFISSTKKTPQHSEQIYSSPEADAAVAAAVAGAEAAAALGPAVAVEAVEAAVVVEVAPAAAAVVAFGFTGAAEAA